MTKKIPIYDQRMFELLEFALSSGECKTQKEFYERIGLKSIPNAYEIKQGKQSFVHAHFMKAAKSFDVDMNWFYGFSSNMKRSAKNISPLEKLKTAVFEIEKELAKSTKKAAKSAE